MSLLRSALMLPLLAAALSSVLATAAYAASAEIVASKRTFTPAVLSLQGGEPVTLVIRNEDEDLHAFVPLLLFQGVNVQISGNGAPEFNETGLARVLIPPHGTAELRFTPKQAGTFYYLCDLPGHNMRGAIEVNASLAH